MPKIDQLLDIMQQLRDPENGCPWDKQQTFETIIPYTIEEAYEVAEAIEQKDFVELKAELGDLLFQVVFYSQMAKEKKLFDFNDVVVNIIEKMLRRHPHVFAGQEIGTAEQQSDNWEAIKAQERKEKQLQKSKAGVLDDICRTLPAITRAYKIQKRAAKVGFDWPDITPVMAKVIEELDEVKAEIESGSQQRLEEEIGDLLFSCINLARHTKVEPESALRKANQRFTERFQLMEKQLTVSGQQFSMLSLDELNQLWLVAKEQTKLPSSVQ